MTILFETDVTPLAPLAATTLIGADVKYESLFNGLTSTLLSSSKLASSAMAVISGASSSASTS